MLFDSKIPMCPSPEGGRHVAERLCFKESIGLEELRAGQPDAPGPGKA